MPLRRIFHATDGNKTFCFFVSIQVCTTEDTCRYAKVSELFVYEKFSRVGAEAVEAGDICAVCGISDIQVELNVIFVYRLFVFYMTVFFFFFF